ncbi:MAG: hypothetical protein M4D80_13545 [Myxococcota bacterium]|nr:hypothetical protein [Deltaproteobacteria bacterium]MDQ3336188.1 hypothetical protein [Myxococcota bacterium]
MVDRQDIDALLIGSLYGELSSTEEARLTAHLESHPSDRTALANLTHARSVVRESLILHLQFEPPQSISALLMQEAARRAPKSREEASWFQRFMRSFMTHPAMAAAAMLVLIVGVAGTVYMRKGDHFANQTAPDRSADLAPTTEQQPAAAPERGVADNEFAGSGQAAPGDNYRVDLADESLRRQGEDTVVGGADKDRKRAEGALDSQKNKSGDTLAFETSDRRDQAKLAKEDANTGFGAPNATPPAKTPVAKTTTKPAKPSSPRLDVQTPSQAPKDFDSSGSKPTDSVATGAGTSSAPRAADPKPGNAPAPPPPPPAVTVATEEKQEKADPNVAWAKEQHAKVIAAVRAGKCETAASIAVGIANRVPAYYTTNVENDRTIKPCMQYITAQREKEAERVQRAKSTQRRAADEAPAPSKK